MPHGHRYAAQRLAPLRSSGPKWNGLRGRYRKLFQIGSLFGYEPSNAWLFYFHTGLPGDALWPGFD